VRTSADEHRRIAGEFTATVEATTPAAWDHPAPPEGTVVGEPTGGSRKSLSFDSYS